MHYGPPKINTFFIAFFSHFNSVMVTVFSDKDHFISHKVSFITDQISLRDNFTNSSFLPPFCEPIPTLCTVNILIIKNLLITDIISNGVKHLQ